MDWTLFGRFFSQTHLVTLLLDYSSDADNKTDRQRETDRQTDRRHRGRRKIMPIMPCFDLKWKSALLDYSFARMSS
jgi:hypothetical protein